jgi:electron transfer flavoprotein beta subunit
VNIIVFIKQVADTEARIVIGGDGTSLEIENKYAMNFFDEFAMEEALRLRDKAGASTVTACAFGGPKAIEVLRTAIAMGADRAFLIENPDAESDPLVIAMALSAFAGKEGYDLILTGRQAIDDENGAVGPMVAELLGIPHVSAVTKVDLKDGKVVAEHDCEGGRETVEAALPVLLTAQKGLNEPRVPLITGVMKAMKAEIPTLRLSSLGIEEKSAVRVLSYEAPPKRPPVKIVEGETPEEKAKNLVRLLTDEARVL